MNFQINIDMDNDSFAISRRAEVARLLTKVVRKIWSGEIDVSQPGYVLVLNGDGNIVGNVYIDGDDDA